jgi:hypothetical protein
MFKKYTIRAFVVLIAICLVGYYCYWWNMEFFHRFNTMEGANGVTIPVWYINTTYVWIVLSIHFSLLLFLWKYPRDSFFRLSMLFPMLILFVMEFIKYGVQ